MKLMKFSTLVLSTLTLVAALTANAASSDSANVEAKNYAAIKSKLLRIGLQPSKIEASPMPGVLQVFTNRGVFYTSEDGQYFVAGRLFDIDAGMVNLTEASLANMRVEGVKEFSDSMIVFPAKDEKHRVTVFTDTTCGYCKKMHAQMEEYNNLGITVQYLAFPRSGMNSQGFSQIKDVWCSANQQTAMTKAKSGSSVSADNCDAPIMDHYSLGQAVGVTGTPAIVFENGSMIPGYKPPQALLQDLSR